MKRVLLVHRSLQPPGGGNAVAAWALQALLRDYEVHLLTWSDVELGIVNRTYGTALRWTFHHHQVPRRQRALIDPIPLPLTLMRQNLVFRAARRLIQRIPFDAVISTTCELDVGRPAIQYVHYPWAAFPRPDADYRWYHYSWPLRAYRRSAARLSGYRPERIGNNLTLVNSDWTGDVFRRFYPDALPTTTVYPPVPGGFAPIPFEDRDDRFVCAGRIAPEKELVKVIEILAAVRDRGHDVVLDLIGHPEDRGYLAEVRRAAAPHRAWIREHFDLPRYELVQRFETARYGIHGMVGEHFGIAPAEMLRAGCIPFLPSEGGQAEIVGRDPRLLYDSPADAVAKIDAVLSQPDRQRAVLGGLDAHRAQFSEAQFMARIQQTVARFIDQGVGAGA